MDWFRWHTGSTTDPKFRVVARKAALAVPGVRLSDVLAVWAMLLERASESDERGVIEGYDCESADAHLDLPDGAACAIVQALQDKGIITPERVCKWDQRQPKREDGSAERSRRWREEQKANATERRRTQPNATERNRTLEEIREEENKKKTPPIPPPPVETPPADPAPPRQQESRGGLSESQIQENPEGIGTHEWDGPIELLQLAEIFPEDRRDLGAAEIALKALSKMRKWPGMVRVMDDLAKRTECELWTRDDRRYMPNLSRYIREMQWKNPIPTNSRASPTGRPEDAAVDDIANKFRKEKRHELSQTNAG